MRVTQIALPIAFACLGIQACVFWDMDNWSGGERADGSAADVADGSAPNDATSPDDDASNDASTNSDVEVDAAVPILAHDTFSRVFVDGFGDADVGGTWTVTSPGAFAVNEKGTMTISGAGLGAASYLPQTQLDDVDVQLSLSANKIALGGSGIYIGILGRRIDSNDDYNGRVVIRDTGEVDISVSRNQGGNENPLPGGKTLFVIGANEILRARLQVTGVSPTRLRLKVWKNGSTEPLAWGVDTQDNTSNFQRTGNVGLRTYVANGTTTTPIEIAFDDFLVRPASRL